MSKVQQDQLKKMGIPESKIQEYYIAFTLFAGDQGAAITTQNLSKLYNGDLGQAYNDADFQTMISEFLGPAAAGGGLRIDFVAFASTLHKNMGGWSDAYGDAYDMIDMEKKGVITRDGLKGFMGKLGERLTDEEAGTTKQRGHSAAASRSGWLLRK